MRRQIGLVLIVLGVTFTLLAPLMRWYAAPRLAKIPAGGQTVSDAIGENVTYIDFADGGAQKTGTVRSRDLYTNVKDDANSSTVVYEENSEIYATAEPNTDTNISSSQERFALNRRTGEAVADPKNQERIDTDVADDAAKHSGYILKLPFGVDKNTEYPFFDSTTRKTFPLKFDGEEKVGGLNTYRFIQTIPATELQEGANTVRYSNTRTVWIEPTSGVVVKGQSDVSTQLLDSTGAVSNTVLKGVLAYTDDNVTASAKRASDAKGKIDLIKGTVPVLLLVLGLILLLAGLYMVHGPQRRRDEEAAEENATEPIEA